MKLYLVAILKICIGKIRKILFKKYSIFIKHYLDKVVVYYDHIPIFDDSNKIYSLKKYLICNS